MLIACKLDKKIPRVRPKERVLCALGAESKHYFWCAIISDGLRRVVFGRIFPFGCCWNHCCVKPRKAELPSMAGRQRVGKLRYIDVSLALLAPFIYFTSNWELFYGKNLPHSATMILCYFWLVCKIFTARYPYNSYFICSTFFYCNILLQVNVDYKFNLFLYFYLDFYNLPTYEHAIWVQINNFSQIL